MSAEAPSTSQPSPSAGASRPLVRLDAGWFFLIAGLLVVGATILIPAQHDLDVARWQLARTEAIQKHRDDRVERYGEYLSALKRQDESVMLSLAATQLNKTPADRVPLKATTSQTDGVTSASVFPDLEPPPVQLPGEPVINENSSLLERWTNDNRIRVWLLAGGALCILIGLLPPSVRR